MFYSADSTAQNTSDDRELDVLEHVHREAEEGRVSQRAIAQALGMSVGLTNAILKRLTEKGFLMIRRINSRNAHYLVTPDGIEQLSRRSYRYLRRTVGHVVRYKERLRDFCRQQKESGAGELVLVGESDLAFILEWCCDKDGLTFRHIGATDVPEAAAAGSVVVLAETFDSAPAESLVLLRDVLA